MFETVSMVGVSYSGVGSSLTVDSANPMLSYYSRSPSTTATTATTITTTAPSPPSKVNLRIVSSDGKRFPYVKIQEFEINGEQHVTSDRQQSILSLFTRKVTVLIFPPSLVHSLSPTEMKETKKGTMGIISSLEERIEQSLALPQTSEWLQCVKIPRKPQHEETFRALLGPSHSNKGRVYVVRPDAFPGLVIDIGV